MMSSPNRLIAIVFGAAYLLIGGAGFLVPPEGLLLGLFEVNLPHNVVHVVIGAALLMAGLSGARPAKTVNGVVGALCLALGLVGLFVVGTPFNVLAINGADNVLHFGSAVLLLAVGVGAELVDAPSA